MPPLTFIPRTQRPHFLLCVPPDIPKATSSFSFLPKPHLFHGNPALRSLLGGESLPGKHLELLKGGRFLSVPPRGNCSIPSWGCPQVSLSHVGTFTPHTLLGRIFLVLVCVLWVHFPSFWGTAKLLHPSETQPLLDSTAADSRIPPEQQK